MNSRHIVHARCKGLKSRFRVTDLPGMERAIESQFLFENSLFEVPVLPPSMLRLARDLAFS